MLAVNRLKLLIGAGACSLIAGCGVNAQREPHAVELPRRPLNVVAPTPVSTGVGGEVAEVICLVREGRLVQRVRRVAARPSAQQQLDDLLRGPTEGERNNGLTSALTGLSLTASQTRVSGEANVEVSEADEATSRSDETIAYGQIVCTLTSRADVTSVGFTRDGERLEVPRADGSLSGGPLSATDYAPLLGPS